MDSFSAALRGAAIMKRYNHPGDWWDGDTVDDSRLRGMNVLHVEQLRRGEGATVSDIEARANAEAIRSWSRAVRLMPERETLIIQEPHHPAYVAVPQEYWDTVLPMLQAL